MNMNDMICVNNTVVGNFSMVISCSEIYHNMLPPVLHGMIQCVFDQSQHISSCRLIIDEYGYKQQLHVRYI
jgi:hypothetical protein